MKFPDEFISGGAMLLKKITVLDGNDMPKREIRFGCRFEKGGIAYFIEDKASPHALHVNPKKIPSIIQTIYHFHDQHFRHLPAFIFFCAEYAAFGYMPETGGLMIANIKMDVIREMFATPWL